MEQPCRNGADPALSMEQQRNRNVSQFLHSIGFRSSVLNMFSFICKIAPSCAYKIQKRKCNLRADNSLFGFDGWKILRSDQSFLFLGGNDQTHNVSTGSQP
ncbi:hypothetical protein Ddye_014400 [Dipteronia dyeriana]|uniref:Ankyrin repeat domain-containing protein n=1 Tax=Dipteronia dyeriana TaxID=168575 RepID=A0AAD9X812_9ROSI|nr:hypothetical protein Ddye_014400 [Dipteronia dyeriana]